MKANQEKFQAMFLSWIPMVDEEKILPIGEERIQYEKSVKLLGVTIDKKLSFHEHTTNICLKASIQVKVLHRLKDIVSEDGKLKLFNAYIMSHFNYYPLAWHYCGIKSSVKMEKLHCRALR